MQNYYFYPRKNGEYGGIYVMFAEQVAGLSYFYRNRKYEEFRQQYLMTQLGNSGFE